MEKTAKRTAQDARTDPKAGDAVGDRQVRGVHHFGDERFDVYYRSVCDPSCSGFCSDISWREYAQEKGVLHVAD